MSSACYLALFVWLLCSSVTALQCFVDPTAADENNGVCDTASPCSDFGGVVKDCMGRANGTVAEVVVSAGTHTISSKISLKYGQTSSLIIRGPLATHEHATPWEDASMAVLSCGGGDMLAVGGVPVHLLNVVVERCGRMGLFGTGDGGVHFLDSDDVLVDGVTFHGSTHYSLHLRYSLSTVRNTRFVGNIAIKAVLYVFSSVTVNYDEPATVLENVVMEDNAVATYGIMRLSYTWADIQGLRMNDNTVNGDTQYTGGALYSGGSYGVLRDSVFLRNEGKNGAAMCLADGNSDEWTVRNTWFEGNLARDNGGAIWAQDVELLVEDTTFHNNSAGVDNGGWGGHLCVDGCETDLNVVTMTGGAAALGGAVMMASGRLSVHDSKLHDNQAAQAGALYADHFVGEDIGEYDIVITNTTFRGNRAKAAGALRVGHRSQLTVTHCELYDNHATDEHGGVATLEECDARFENNTIRDNTALLDAAVFLVRGTALRLVGGEVYNNHAGTGGVVTALFTAEVILENTSIRDNTARSTGGAFHLYNQAQLTVRSSVVQNSQSGSDGGCAFMSEQSHLVSEDSEWLWNKAGGDGGVVYVMDQASVSWNRSVASHNQASNGGVVFTRSPSSHVFEGVTMSNNSALQSAGCFGSTGYGGALYYDGFACVDTLRDVRLDGNSAVVAGGDVFATNPTVDCSPSSLLPACDGVCTLQSPASQATYGASQASWMQEVLVAAMKVNGATVETLSLLPGDVASLELRFLDALGEQLAGSHHTIEVDVSLRTDDDRVLMAAESSTVSAADGRAYLQNLQWGTVQDMPDDTAAQVVLNVRSQSTAPSEWTVDVTVRSCDSAGLVWMPHDTIDGRGVCVEDVKMSTTQRTPLLVLLGVTVVLLVTSMVVLCTYRGSRVVFAASFSFMMVISAGLLLCVAAATISILEQTDVLCMSSMWLLHVGFSLVFGAMWVKQFRLWRIFNNIDLEVRAYPNATLQKLLAGYVTLLCGVLLVWTLAWPREVLSEFQPMCTSEREDEFQFTLLGVHVTLLLSLLYLSLRTRGVPRMYNEASWINFSIYNVLTFGTVGLVLAYGAGLDTTDKQVLFVAVVCGLVLTTMGFYLWSKLYRIIVNHDEFTVLNVTSSSSSDRSREADGSRRRTRQSKGQKRLNKYTVNINEGRQELQVLRNRFQRMQDQMNEIMAEYRQKEQAIATFEFEKQYIERRRMNLEHIKSSYDLRPNSSHHATNQSRTEAAEVTDIEISTMRGRPDRASVPSTPTASTTAGQRDGTIEPELSSSSDVSIESSSEEEAGAARKE